MTRFPTKTQSLLRLVMLIGFILSTGACGQETTTPDGVDTVDSLIRALRATGVEVLESDEHGPTVLGLTPTVVRLGGQQVLLFNSPETLDSQRVLAAFDQDPGLQYLWGREHLLVLYEGSDGGTVLVLESLLGTPLIGPPVPGDEPYPPAIPAAIRVIAAERGAQPTEIEVLAYEVMEWSDACLDFEQLDEVCAAVITPGWRIELRLGELEIEAHTDLLGLNVRWRSP